MFRGSALHIDEVYERPVDEETAGRSKNADKYVGRRLLLAMRLVRTDFIDDSRGIDISFSGILEPVAKLDFEAQRCRRIGDRRNRIG